MKNNFKFTLMVLSTFLGSFCTIQNTGAMKMETCAVCGKKVKTFLDKGCCYCNSKVNDKLDTEETVIEFNGIETKLFPKKSTKGYCTVGKDTEHISFEVKLTNKLSEKDKYHSLYWYSFETLCKYTRSVQVEPIEFCEVIGECMEDKKRASEWENFIMSKHCSVTANIFKMPSEEPIIWFDIKYVGDTNGKDDDFSSLLDDTEYRTLPERERYTLYGLKKPNNFSKLVMTNDGRGLWVRLRRIVES